MADSFVENAFKVNQRDVVSKLQNRALLYTDANNLHGIAKPQISL